jgi:diaminobutyrate-2-oxoglutarate transaminase
MERIKVLRDMIIISGGHDGAADSTPAGDAGEGNSEPPSTTEHDFREPAADDGADMWSLVKQTGVLDLNSSYSYIILAEHFTDTCIVAERDDKVVGFVTAYIPPKQPDTLFVWQVGVAEEERGNGLASSMLEELLQRPACAGVNYLEATVTPSNAPSSALFRAFARSLGTVCTVQEGFHEDLFPGDEHEPELLFRIGPFKTFEDQDMDIFQQRESNVRSYCRGFPTVFTRAKGHRIWGEDGKEYIDFFAGAGALNYGHNPDAMKEKLLAYVAGDGVSHSLDMSTGAKAEFLTRFQEVILESRGMDHKVMFPGPTGTNTVEAALKLARKVTGRTNIVNFTNAFHGMTLGALAVTGNAFKRGGAGVPLNYTDTMPYDGYMGDGVDTLDYFEKILDDAGSGIETPAAVIVEAVQGEGGLNVAGFDWLKKLEGICRAHGILLILDDIQAGCGRTGTFFSFDPAGIDPDIICLSKSISGYGLPMALTLIKREYDKFGPGEHNGTFRGNNAAFVTATEALSYWEDDKLSREVEAKAEKLRRFLKKLNKKHPELHGELRGRGLMQGIAVGVDGLAEEICAACFERGLLMETSGPDSEVFKIMPPLTIDDVAFEKGLAILANSVEDVLARKSRARNVA